MLMVVKVVLTECCRVDLCSTRVENDVSLFLMDLYHLWPSDLLDGKTCKWHPAVRFLLTSKQFGKYISDELNIHVAMRQASEQGHFELLEMLLNYYGAKVALNEMVNNPIGGAIAHNNVAMLDRITDQLDYLPTEELGQETVESGQVEPFKILHARGWLDPSDVRGLVREAVRYGYVEVVMYLLGLKIGETDSVEMLLEEALQYGKVAVAKELYAMPRYQPNRQQHVEDRKESDEARRKPFDINECRKALVFTASIDEMEWVLEHFPSLKLDQLALEAACRSPRLEMVQWLHARLQAEDPKAFQLAVNAACQNGRLDTVKFFAAKGILPTNLHAAIVTGRVEMVQYLCSDCGLQLQLSSSTITSAFNTAIECGHADMVQYLLAQPGMQLQTTREAMETALSRCHVKVLRLLDPARKRRFAEREALINAARRGDVAMLDYLLLVPPERAICCEAIRGAVRGGHVDVVELLYEQMKRLAASTQALRSKTTGESLFNQTFIQELVSEQYLDGLEIVLQAEPLDGYDLSQLLKHAVATRKLQLIRLLHSKGVDAFTAATMNQAAKAGALGIVRFLHEHREEGCTAKAMDKAAKNGFLQVVQFLQANRSEGCTEKALIEAAANGHLRVVEFLHQHCRHYWGSAGDQAMTRAGTEGHLLVVQFLQAHGYPCAKTAVVDAARRGHRDVVAFLVTTGCAPVHVNTLLAACQHGHFKVVSWLVANTDYVEGYQRALKAARRYCHGADRGTQKNRLAKCVACLEANDPWQPSTPATKRLRVE